MSKFTKIVLVKFDSGISIGFELKKKDPDQDVVSFLTEFGKKVGANIYLKYPKSGFSGLLKLHQNRIFYKNFNIDLEFECFVQATKEGFDKIRSVIYGFLNKFEKRVKVADIYSGFGSYSFEIADKFQNHIVDAFEGDEQMISVFKNGVSKNALWQKLKCFHRDLFKNPLSAKEISAYDVAIINPPRNGAGPQIKLICESKVKNVVLVCCNNASFARDAATLQYAGFKIKTLSAIDQFYSTDEFESVGVFTR